MDCTITPYDERFAQYVEFYATLAQRGTGPAAAWGEFIGQLQFRLGESVAEAHVPYAVADDIQELCAHAVQELATLLRRRHEPGFDDRVWDNLSIEERLRVKLRPRAYPVHRSRDESPEAEAIRRAMVMDPLLDAGIVEAWLAKDSAADRLAAALRELYARMVKAECTGCEPVGVLFHACLVREITTRKAASTDLQVKGVLYERLDRAAAVALQTLMRTVLDGCAAGMGPLHHDPVARAMYLFMALSVGPLSFVGIRKAIMQADHNPYGLAAETIGLVDTLLPAVGRQAPDEAIETARAQLTADPELRRRLMLAQSAPRFREDVIRFLSCRDSRVFHDAVPWHDLLGSNDALAAVLGRSRDHQALVASIDDTLARIDRRSVAFALGQVVHADLGAHAAVIGDRDPRDAAARCDDLVRRYLVLRLDAAAAAQIDLVLPRLDDRRAKVPLAQVRAEYEEGRLYRFSTDDRPVIKARAVATCGQLFIDLKGYTKRTSRAKELVMADFLRDQFYVPLVYAAHRLSLDRLDRHDPALLDLSNLPGDAMALSGTVTSLLAFAHEAREVFAAYTLKLQGLLTGSGVAGQIASVRRRHAEEDGRLAAEIEAAVRAQGGRPGEAHPIEQLRSVVHVEDLRARRNALREEADEEVRQLGGFGLESGLFISHGAAHETIRMRDEVWGDLHVSVGEKINEAARGTARNGLVKARLDARLDEARVKAGSPDLSLPFAVYVDAYTNLSLPADLATLFENAIASRDLARAAYASKIFAQHLYLDFERSVASGGARPRVIGSASDIYNIGQAISGDALDGYIRERRMDTVVTAHDLRADELHPVIRSSFALFRPGCRFVVACDPAKGGAIGAIFRYEGQVLFKGFEGRRPTEVYEILDPRTPFYAQLLAHHAAAWAAAAAANPSTALASLPPAPEAPHA